MQTGKKTFTIEVIGKGIEKVTMDVDKLRESLDKLDKAIPKSGFSVSLNAVMGSCESVTDLLKNVEVQIDKLVKALEKTTASPSTKTQETTKPDTPKSTPTTSTITSFKDAGEELAKKIKNMNPDDITKAISKVLEEGINGSKANFGLGVIKVDGALDKGFSTKTKGNSKITDVEETKKDAKEKRKGLDENEAALTKAKKDFGLFIEGVRKELGEGSKEAVKAVEEKFNSAADSKQAEIKKGRDSIDTVTDKMEWGGMKEFSDQFTYQDDEYRKLLTGSFDKLTGFFKDSSALYEAEAKKVGESIKEIDTKLTASTQKRKSLIEEEKTATGGRAIALQEQVAREIAAEEELTAQKTKLEEEKKKLEEKAAKEKRNSERVTIAKNIILATADVAKGVSAELSKGLIGIPTAAIIAAQGAIQIVTLKKQLDKINADKKADGGLLFGKRHSQGGMRIEGTNIEVEGDEYVINRESTRKNMSLIDYINRSRKEITADDINSFYSRQGKNTPAVSHSVMQRLYQDGGLLTNLDTAESAASNRQNDKILEAISNINIRPVVSVVEITDAQQSITSLRSAAGAL